MGEKEKKQKGKKKKREKGRKKGNRSKKKVKVRLKFCNIIWTSIHIITDKLLVHTWSKLIDDDDCTGVFRRNDSVSRNSKTRILNQHLLQECDDKTVTNIF